MMIMYMLVKLWGGFLVRGHYRIAVFDLAMMKISVSAWDVKFSTKAGWEYAN